MSEKLEEAIIANPSAPSTISTRVVHPTYVDIGLGASTIKAELQIDGTLFAVSACGGLPNGLVAFGRTVQEACDNFVVSCINHPVKTFGQFGE